MPSRRTGPFFQGILTGVLATRLRSDLRRPLADACTRPTVWARYPAVGLGIAAVLACFSGGNSNLFWAIAFLAAGVVLVVYSFLRKKPS